MNIIELAKQAGASYSSNPEDYDVLKITDGSLQAFAALVAAHEREECAKLCDEVGKESLSQWPYRFANMIRARGEA